MYDHVYNSVPIMNKKLLNVTFPSQKAAFMVKSFIKLSDMCRLSRYKIDSFPYYFNVFFFLQIEKFTQICLNTAVVFISATIIGSYVISL